MKQWVMCACIFALLSYRYYVPIPEEFEHRVLHIAGMGVQKFLTDLCHVAHAITGTSISELRGHVLELFMGSDLPSSEDMQIENIVMAGVPVRVYTPKLAVRSSRHDDGGVTSSIVGGDAGKGGGGGGAAVVFYHGGGFVFGSIRVYDYLMQFIARQAGVKLFSVGYRRAPAHVFPTAHDDCMKVTEYILDHALELGVDVTRVAVMGDSAGGHIAATVSQAMRSSPVRPKLQLLIYPALQFLDFRTPSHQQNGDSHLVLSTDNVVEAILLYLFGKSEEHKSTLLKQNAHISAEAKIDLTSRILNHTFLPDEYFPKNYVALQPAQDSSLPPKEQSVFLDRRVCPLCADEVSGLPKTYIYTAGYDVLRDDGTWYAMRLQAAGVPVYHYHHQASYHGMMYGLGYVPQGSQCVMGIVEYLQEHL